MQNLNVNKMLYEFVYLTDELFVNLIIFIR